MSKRKKTNDQWNQYVKENVLVFIMAVRLEIVERKKKLSADDNEILELVRKRIEEDNQFFDNNKDRQAYYGTITREVAWKCSNKEEADMIINNLRSDNRLFAQKFFYGTNPQGCNISRFRSKIISKIKQTYNEEVSVEEFGNILYTFLWDNNTWSVLNKYSCKSSFFSWLEQIAFHEVIKSLEEMKRINVNRERTPGNTRLVGISVPPEIWSIIISDLMPEGLFHDVLTATLVDRKSRKQIEADLGLLDNELDNIQKKAEAKLRDRIIRGNSYYEELVLRDKSPRNITVSSDYVKDFIKWQVDKNEQNPLSDIFGINLNEEELYEKVMDFLYEFPKQLKWTDDDRLLWRLRFIENTSPVEVVKCFGKDRSWIDTRYSRLKARFNQAIKLWWENNAQ